MKTKLNDSQLQAVRHDNGPLLIVAGAGTGKTTVITNRIAYLVDNGKAKPEEILALTFTEKAAGEMIERLDEKMPFGYEEPWIGTFHWFCDRILKEEGLEIGLSPDYEIASESDSWMLMKKNILKLGLKYYAPLGNPNKFIGEILKFFSRLEDEDIDKPEIDKFKTRKSKFNTKEEKEEYAKYCEVFKAYEIYNKLKIENNLMDFGDLISWTLKLFRSRKNILAKYQKQFKYILVDEFQDTNFAQLALIKLLAPPEKSPNLTVVGDDDQSIYAFRGSSVFNILDFKQHYPEAKEVVLTTNYRSTQQILNTAYKTIVNNNPKRLEEVLKIDKKLVAARGQAKIKPQIIEVSSLENEAEFVVDKILDLVGKDYEYKDVAILARANSHLEPFVASLRRSGIPYQLIGNRGLFDQEEIRDLIFFLKSVANANDSNNLFYFLHSQINNIKANELIGLINQSKSNSVSLWSIIIEKAEKNFKYKKIINYIKKAQLNDAKKSIVEIIFDFINDCNYIKQFTKTDSIENQLKIKNINLFLERLKKYDSKNPKTSVTEYVDYFDMLLEANENPAQAQIEDIDTVNLMTIHAAKGLEWPIVFIVNMVAGRFPSMNRKDKIELPEEFVKQGDRVTDNICEERRLFYVALTRAKDFLFLVYGKDYGGKYPKKRSKMLAELGLDYKIWQDNKQKQLFRIPAGVDYINETRVNDGKIRISSISYSQIDIYRTCPLRYKYQNIIKIPQQDHHALTFGNTIHNTLQTFHQFEMAGQKPDLTTLLHIYEKKFIPIGYESEEHKIKRFEEGKNNLKKYWQKYESQFEGKRLTLEKTFRIPLIDNVFLRGKIDRVDQLPTGELEVIDYKTGSLKKQDRVDKDKQLTIYSMAAKQLFGKIPEILSLYFIDETKKVSSTRSQKQIDKEKGKIMETVEQIQSGNFEAKPGMMCQYCPYNRFCPFAAK